MKSSRREFLKHTACAALGLGAMSGALTDLRRVAAATMAESGPIRDYKALVCLFLQGGNDSFNMLVPRTGTDYTQYAQQRGNLALPQNSLLPIAPKRTNGREYGLHPNLPGLQNLFHAGKLALLANVGTLVVPTTRDQFQAGTVPLPPSLFSHNDQETHWQTSLADQPPTTGWGGRMADLMHSINGDAPISMNISIAGTNMFETGNSVSQYHVSTNGTIGMNDYDDNPSTLDQNSTVVNQIMAMESNNFFENEFRAIKRRSLDNNRILRTALQSAQEVTTQFPNTYLGQQLKMVARLIAARNVLGMRRQIFFCQAGGYDTHGDQLSAHANLLAELNAVITSFYSATAELGVVNQVTTFTASDFGRTYPTNGGQGTDHGWGGHQMIMGGAVRGRDIYGQMPILTINGPNDSGDQGRWLPTTSVDQYSATLARWFGVSESNLPLVVPNVGRFSTSNLEFMNERYSNY